MKVFLIVMVILLMLGLLPLTLRAKLDYIVSENHGALCIYFFRIKVFIAKVYLDKNKILIKTKHKCHEIILSNLRSGKDFKSKFIKNLILSLRYNNVRLLSSIGLDNAMYSALSCGALDMLCGMSFMALKDKLNVKNYSYVFMPSFLSFGAVVALSSSISFSLMQVLYVFATSI